MLPERFGRDEVLDEIGDGAMGRVYRAWDPAVKRVVAVKSIKSEYLTRDTAHEYLKRFHREAQSAGGLNHGVFDRGDDDLVMELVEGRTLHRLIREGGRLAPEETLRLLAPVADAVDHAHRAGIVHRDIKPANIMVQPPDRRSGDGVRRPGPRRGGAEGRAHVALRAPTQGRGPGKVRWQVRQTYETVS